MHHSNVELSNSFSPLFWICLFFLLTFGYIGAIYISNKRLKKWPHYRTGFWLLGIISALLSVIGPVALKAHLDFAYHMISHLLLGMLAPLLLVLAKPMTLLLRTLPIQKARRFTTILKSRPILFFTHPITASILNVGGLWVLYTTNIYHAMHQYIILHIFVHVHILLAGYLFTASMIYLDPIPHRYSFPYRTSVFVVTLGAHGVLSKYIYAHPPSGVPETQAQVGGMLMYYGGDLIDAILIFILCLQWYQATKPNRTDILSTTS